MFNSILGGLSQKLSIYASDSLSSLGIKNVRLLLILMGQNNAGPTTQNTNTTMELMKASKLFMQGRGIVMIPRIPVKNIPPNFHAQRTTHKHTILSV